MALRKFLLCCWALCLGTTARASANEHLPLRAPLIVTPKELELVSANFTDFSLSSHAGSIVKRYVYTCSAVDMVTVSAAYNQASQMVSPPLPS